MDDKEFTIIDILSKSGDVSQRELSKATGWSIGTVNIILHKLAQKGYIKIRQLNKKKVQYILTPRGFREKARKTYRYLKKVVSAINTTREQIKNFILKQYRQGYRIFVLHGDGDFFHLFELCAKELQLSDVQILKNTDLRGDDQRVINIYCGEEIISHSDNNIKHISEIV